MIFQFIMNLIGFVVFLFVSIFCITYLKQLILIPHMEGSEDETDDKPLYILTGIMFCLTILYLIAMILCFV